MLVAAAATVLGACGSDAGSPASGIERPDLLAGVTVPGEPAPELPAPAPPAEPAPEEPSTEQPAPEQPGIELPTTELDAAINQVLYLRL